MRELLREEFGLVAGGDAECDDLGNQIMATATTDGILAGAAAATLLPGAGPLVGGVIAAATVLGGAIIASEVVEACEKHKEEEKKTGT